MINQPNKIALTGLFIGAVAIAVSFSQLGHSWLSPHKLALERDNEGAQPPRGDTRTGPVTAKPAVVPDDSTAIAGQTYAVRNSLQNNDLTTAQSQPEAARTANKGEDQVLAPPGNVQAPVAQMQPAPASARANRAAQQGPKSARTSLAGSGQTGRAYGPHAAPRGASNPTSTYAESRRDSESAVAAGSAASTSGAKTAGSGEGISVGSLNSDSAEVKAPAQPVLPLPSGSPSEPTARASPTSSPLASQLGATGGTLLQPESGPKTRAQVRAEIAQARADGSLPAFGNPDPAGPGGAPSLILLPRP
ncbi:DUF4148 domain-containing protein [Paraburkholderia jirisanensis]